MRLFHLFLLQVVIVCSCNNVKDNLSTQINCDGINYPLSILRETSHNEFNFTVEVPKSWISDVSYGDIDKIVAFSGTHQAGDMETLYFGQTPLPDKFSIKDEFNTVLKKRTLDTNIVVLDNGVCVIDDLNGKWFLADNFLFKSDSLDTKDLYVLVASDKNYYSIFASVYGNNEVEERMCQLINVLYTFEEK